MQWKEWTTSGLHDRTTGIPAADARRIAARVSGWAADIDAGTGDPLLMSVSAAGLALAQAIEALGEDLLPALLIERMIEQVLADVGDDQSPARVVDPQPVEERALRHEVRLDRQEEPERQEHQEEAT